MHVSVRGTRQTVQFISDRAFGAYQSQPIDKRTAADAMVGTITVT
jgi:hypothetical protein